MSWKRVCKVTNVPENGPYTTHAPPPPVTDALVSKSLAVMSRST